MTAPQDFKLTDGTVIDHLPVGTSARALDLLSLPREGPVTVGMNVPSGRMGRKDIIRVEGLAVARRDLDRLALLGEQVTVSIVTGGRVTDKVELEVPRRLMGILACPNATCITNTEPMETVFHRLPGFPYRFRCAYCERVSAG
jgi:aspartate carbamoyltransferase regulatory subunit